MMLLRVARCPARGPAAVLVACSIAVFGSVVTETGFADTSVRRRSAERSRGSDTPRQGVPVSSASGDASNSPLTREAGETIPESALPPLPEVPRLEVRQPTAEDLQELNAKLNALFAEAAETRDNVVAELVEVQPRMIAAIHQRVLQLAEHADKERMKRLFGDARRDTLSRRGAAQNPTASDSGVLQSLLASAHPKDQSWRDCVMLAAMTRMLSASGTVDGARELVAVYAKFGEFVRVEVQQRLADMKDRALAALIESRRHPAEKIARWAALRLDQMGRAIPSESVRTNDYEALADILRAYGRVRDPDAARIVISFANSERTQLRLAARQAIVMLGSVGLWQLRDAYEDVVGKRPRRDWTWERTARELFGEFDRLRLARVYGTFMEGLRHLEKGELEAMARSFDVVLAKDPLFEKRSQMAPGYFRLAHSLQEKNPSAALDALVRVDRLSTDADLLKQAQSLANALRAIQATSRGVLDVNRLSAAIELDPRNSVARSTLAKWQPNNLTNRYSWLRWIASAVIALAGLIGVFLIWMRRPRTANSEPEGEPPEPQADNASPDA